MRYLSNSEEETFKIGEEFGKTLREKDVVALFGGLGAGKTCFTKGLAKGLGVKETVTSPTFAILNEYRGRLSLHHFDMYRIGGEDALFETGFTDCAGREGVCAVEWSENILPSLPQSYYRVELLPGEEENQRIIMIDKTEEKR